ncbi:APC family permease [Acidocella sp. KAb 2-4]|uniref:APC family permease n=1 Tax=Acidocella sp. KAb 2-4 TaxID=2885158 RepID=UPI001D064D72|nr:APC family permease [Acidocella sp. KAb 2-4]MCB5944077.1 APC family permease [Acidocella sp. KAb 2-4]
MSESKITGTIDVGKRENVAKLHSKAVGVIGVLFLCVTGAAPESAMLGNVPFAAGFGTGVHTPAAFLLATIVLVIFSVGYATMASQVSSVGGFYSYIAQGLGRELGMSAGLTALACYSIFEASLYGLFAYFGNIWLSQHLGINIGWVWLALAAVVGAGVLSLRDVRLSTAVLGTAVLCETVVLLIFSFGVALAHGGTSFSLEALNIFHVTVPVAAQKVGNVAIPAGAAAVGIFMAFWSWVGFEMAPNYAEESRNPKRVIPIALYSSVILLGVIYTFVSWCGVSAYPNAGAMLAQAVNDSGDFYLTPMKQFVGDWGYQALSFLILTSSFACGMAFHNTTARYMYSLGREGILPHHLGKTHDVLRSPHYASVVQSVLAAAWIVLFGVFNGFNSPMDQAYDGIYTLYAVLGTGLLLVLQAFVSLAIWNYFRKNGGGSLLKTTIAPWISFVVQLWLVYLLVSNLVTFAGSSAFANAIPYIGGAIIAVGLVWGFVLKHINPEAYKHIGHMVHEID